jgi:hypothetical protein
MRTENRPAKYRIGYTKDAMSEKGLKRIPAI